MAELSGIQRRVQALAVRWLTEQDARRERDALDPADFEALAAAGFTRTGAPREAGGVWTNLGACIRPYAAMIESLAEADPSLALVASMHPVVLGYWLGAEGVAAGPDWEAQRQDFHASAVAGDFWGTITSEPGSGGDLLRTRATASADGQGGFRLSGDKHFGSGSGLCRYMITTARDGEHEEPQVFVLDMAGLDPLVGGPGVTLTRPWDGYGMRATQSHAMRFEGFPAVRHASPEGAAAARPVVSQLSAVLFSAVVLAVLEQSLAAARPNLQRRGEALRAGERVGWVSAENRCWLARQAFEGMLRAVEAGDGIKACSRGKFILAELAETTLLELGRVVGGASLARSEPFGQWLQDVRALGFLRPPWGLAMDQLFEMGRP